MSEANRVLWSEGLFLRPQHFQQQDRHTEALVRGALQAGPLHAWGFRTLALDAARLETGRVAVTEARGILPDGTPFAIPEAMDPPEPVAVSRDTPAGAVLLALPLETPGGTSFDPAHADPSGARYRGRVERVRDAVQGGGESEEIEIARPAAVLLAPGRDAGGYVTLPVAELTGLDRIAEAHGRMVFGGAGRSVENLLVLELANAARPRLAHMLVQEVYPPAELFRELAGLAGRMATYGSGSRRLSELPAYDHLAPAPAFAALTDTLRSLILSLRYVEPKSRALSVRKRETNVWMVRIDNPGMLDDSRIVVRVGSELSDDALRQIFVHQVTVGSAGEFDALWKSRLPGIPLKPLHSQPREIPYDGDRLCLELDQKSEHWDSLRAAPGFMIGVAGALPSEPQLDCYAVHR